MLTVVAVAAVIKSLTVTAPVNAAEAPLVMVRLLIATDVPVMAPPVPASRPKLKELAPSVMPAPKVINPEPEPNVVLALRVTALEKVIFPPVVIMEAPKLI